MLTRWILILTAALFTAPLQAAISACANFNNTQWSGTLIPNNTIYPQQLVTLNLSTPNAATTTAISQSVTGKMTINGKSYNLLSNSYCTNSNNWVSLQLKSMDNYGNSIWIITNQMAIPFSLISVPLNGAYLTFINRNNPTTTYYSGSLMQQY